MTFLWLALWGIVGMSLGSFVGALAHRYGQGVSPLRPSACDHCERPLSVGQLVPIFSWVGQGGRSSCCGQPLPKSYPLMEGGMCLFFLLLYGLEGDRWEAIIILGLLASALLWLSLIDFKSHRLPHGGVILVGLLGILANPPGYWLSALVLGGGGLILYMLSRKIRGFGMGDVKLMAACGLWLPPTEIPLFLVLAGLGGILTSLLLRERRFAFGPSLGAALMLILILSKAYSYL